MKREADVEIKDGRREEHLEEEDLWAWQGSLEKLVLLDKMGQKEDGEIQD